MSVSSAGKTISISSGMAPTRDRVMNQTSQSSLLPAGLQDLLPPHAANEAAIVRDLLAVFVAQGYQHVKPPLLEFEEALL